MTTSYFLGANSGEGFVSLYGGFAEGARLHVIKGGPGTGKSGFMKKIAAAAEARGYEVETVLCSGDPASLDGVYLPALRQAWADGTAPHILDPAQFGADGDYVNLGAFCRLPLSEADADEVRRLNRAYRERYRAAYAWLRAAAAYPEACLPELSDAELEGQIRRRIDGVLRRHAGQSGGGRRASRFLSAWSCAGRLRLGGENLRAYPTVYQLDDGLGLAGRALRYAAQTAEARGLSVIRCPDPLRPQELEALLLPDDGLALLCGDWELPQARRIRLDALVPASRLRQGRQSLRLGRSLQAQSLEAAVDALREAKALHDQLEAVYRPYMDFDRLSAFTEETIARLFA